MNQNDEIIDNDKVNKHYSEKDSESEGNILDKLFKKTKTKPYIYYLPLTKEQVKQKLEKKKSIY